MTRRTNSERDGRSPQLAFAGRLLAVSDPLDADGWRALLSDDVHLRIANRPTAIGIAPARAELARLFAATEAIGRGFREIWPGDDDQTLLMELDMCPKTGPAIPVAIVVRLAEAASAARDMRFYFDPTPLWARNGLNGGSAHGV